MMKMYRELLLLLIMLVVNMFLPVRNIISPISISITLILSTYLFYKYVICKSVMFK